MSKVNDTKNLQNDKTDLIALPASSNAPLDTGMSSLSAAACGYIYFDDGVSLARNLTRFDYYLALTGVNAANFTVQMIEKGNRTNSSEEELGLIKILQASTAGLGGVNLAHIYVHGAKEAINVTVDYDINEDYLTVHVVNDTVKDEHYHVNLYDLNYIELGVKKTP